jgi:hypothetical protein
MAGIYCVRASGGRYVDAFRRGGYVAHLSEASAARALTSPQPGRASGVAANGHRVPRPCQAPTALPAIFQGRRLEGKGRRRLPGALHEQALRNPRLFAQMLGH